jgi:3',5'-cyclic AMP phosphodiesterase CpdA
MIDLYLAYDPEFIIHTGDLALLGGNWTQLLEFNASMTAVWESGVPFYSAPGNHETYIGGWDEDPFFTNYTQYVHYEDEAAACGGTELYYSFDYGNVHFIILNTEDSWVGNVFECSTEQMTWLQGDLVNIENDTFLVVAFHRPAYSVREARPDRWLEAESIRNEFHSLFLEHDVDLVLTGHDHHYYRSVREGIYYVVTGGGGAPPAGIDKSATAWQAGDVGFNEFHYCSVDVNSSHVTLDVHLMNGTTADSFTIPKLDATSTTTTTSSTSAIDTTTFLIPTEWLVIGIGLPVILVIFAVIWKSRTSD